MIAWGRLTWRVTTIEAVRRCSGYEKPRPGQIFYNYKLEQIARALGCIDDKELSCYSAVTKYIQKHVARNVPSRPTITRLAKLVRQNRRGGDNVELISRQLQLKQKLESCGWAVDINFCNNHEMRRLLLEVAR